MTDRHLGDAHLDAAIDRAVREMMGAEPRADLRERVLAELAGRSAGAALWPRLAFGAAMALVLIVGGLRFFERFTSPTIDQTTGTAQPPIAVPNLNPTPRAPTMATADRGRRTPSDQTTGRVARGPITPTMQDRRVQAASVDMVETPAANAEAMASNARLRSLNLISIGALETRPIVVAEIRVRPLTMGSIEITPLAAQR